MRIIRIENCVTLDSNDSTRTCSFAPGAALFQASADFCEEPGSGRRGGQTMGGGAQSFYQALAKAELNQRSK